MKFYVVDKSTLGYRLTQLSHRKMNKLNTLDLFGMLPEDVKGKMFCDYFSPVECVCVDCGINKFSVMKIHKTPVWRSGHRCSACKIIHKVETQDTFGEDKLYKKSLLTQGDFEWVTAGLSFNWVGEERKHYISVSCYSELRRYITQKKEKRGIFVDKESENLSFQVGINKIKIKNVIRDKIEAINVYVESCNKRGQKIYQQALESMDVIVVCDLKMWDCEKTYIDYTLKIRTSKYRDYDNDGKKVWKEIDYCDGPNCYAGKFTRYLDFGLDAQSSCRRTWNKLMITD